MSIPSGTVLQLGEPTCWTSNSGLTLGNVYSGQVLRGILTSNLTATVAHASARIHEAPHAHSVTYVTGTGFFCGRLYRWSDFQPGESRPLFLTAARRSLMGWVWVDSVGQQVVQCSGGPAIARPSGQ